MVPKWIKGGNLNIDVLESGLAEHQGRRHRQEGHSLPRTCQQASVFHVFVDACLRLMWVWPDGFTSDTRDLKGYVICRFGGRGLVIAVRSFCGGSSEYYNFALACWLFAEFLPVASIASTVEPFRE